MVEAFQNLIMGFSVALTPEMLIYAFVGCLFGTLVGVLPGVGPVAGTALLIPLTFQLSSTGAIIMLAAIFYGSQYGGTITTILLAVPGEASSVVTLFDGHALAKRGRAGAVLSMAAIGSWVGGTFAALCMVIAAQTLARLALILGPPEYFALLTLGLTLVTALAGKSLIRAMIMALFGMLLAVVGMDSIMGIPRFTFGKPELLDGFEFIPVIIGLFGVSEIMLNLERSVQQVVDTKDATLTSLLPTRQEVKDSLLPMVRGSGIGFGLGLIPGMTTVVSSFMAYIAEKKFSRYPEKFGNGVIEGVVGPETANNAHAQGSLLPLFTLGIPASPTAAVIMGAFIINGLIPGPLLFRDSPEVVWGVIASMYIGNILLLILNLPLISMWVQVLRIPYSILQAFILLFIFIGSYSINTNVFDVFVMIGAALVGYVCRKIDLPMAPAILTFILSRPMEAALQQSLVMSKGSMVIFFTRPISLVLLLIAGFILVSFTVRSIPTALRSARGHDSEV